MNRTKIFIINIAFSMLLQIITIISGFIIPKIMVTYYGSETNGLINSIAQFISYFALIEVGLAGAAVSSLFKPLAEKNETEINSILVASKKFYYKVGFIFIGLVLSFSIIYPFFIKSSSLSSIEIGLLALVLGASGTIEFFSILKYRVLLTADQKVYVLSISSILYLLLNTLLIFLLSYSGLNILVVRFIAISSILLRSIILFVYCKRKYKYLNYNVPPNYGALKKKWDVLFIQIADAVQKGSPIIIATFLFSLNDVSVFSTYIIVIVGINSLLSMFSNTLYAPFGDLLVRNEIEVFKNSFNIFESFYYVLVTVIYIISFFVINSFVSVYMQNADISYQLGWVGFLFVINGFLYNLKTPYQTLIPASGKFREIRNPLIIQIIIAVIGGILFGLLWGVPGVLFAMIISNIVYFVLMLLIVPKQMLEKNLMISSIKRTLLCFLCFSLCIPIFIFYKEENSSILSWIKYAIKISIPVCFIVFSVFLIGDFKYIKAGILKILRILHKKKEKNNENEIV